MRECVCPGRRRRRRRDSLAAPGPLLHSADSFLLPPSSWCGICLFPSPTLLSSPAFLFPPAVFLSNLLLFFRLLLQRLGPRRRRQASGVGGHCPPFPEEACCWPARLPPGEKNHLDFKSSRCSESSSGVKEFPQFPMLRLPHPS